MRKFADGEVFALASAVRRHFCHTSALVATVVNLALPLIGQGLHAQVAGLQWTVAAYAIATASLMLSAGSAGDRFGRRAILQAGLCTFTLASIGCGLAPSLGFLITCRALQGVGGAALTPMSMGIIAATFPDPAARARVLGLYTGTFGVGMAAGPVAGGMLAASWGWRSLFLINIFPGLIALVLAGRFIPDSRAVRPRRLDLLGQALVIPSLACFCYGVIEGPAAGWRSPAVLGAFAVAFAACAVLLAVERRRAEPLIELRRRRGRAAS